MQDFFAKKFTVTEQKSPAPIGNGAGSVEERNAESRAGPYAERVMGWC